MMTDFEYESKDLEAMSFAPKYHAWILSKFKKFLGKRVAEIGAGSGNFSLLLMREPIEKLVAIEPSGNVYLELRAKISGDARVVSHNAFFPDVSAWYSGYFDSIIYVDVLEHIENEIEELSCVHRSLRQGGHVCIFVPALSWLYSDHDKSIGHFRRYHKKQLLALLKKAGFEIVNVRYFDIIGIISWLIVYKFLKKKLNPNSIGLYDKYIVPVSRILESFIPPPIGKNLIIIGKKVS